MRTDCHGIVYNFKRHCHRSINSAAHDWITLYTVINNLYDIEINMRVSKK